MVTGFLHDTFHSKFIPNFTLFFIALSVSLMCRTDTTYAAKWFAVLEGGVLSGKLSGHGIIDYPIPRTQIPEGFSSNVVQGSGSGEKTSFGTLISSSTQNVRRSNNTPTDDAFAINTGLSLEGLNFQEIINSPDLTSYNGQCDSMLTGQALDSSHIYRTTVSCLQLAINRLSGLTYSFSSSSDGLVVIVAESSGNSTLTVHNTIIPTDSDDRLLVITDSKVVVSQQVGSVPSSLTFDSPPHIQASIMSVNSGFEIEDSSLVVILEGPVIANNSVLVGRDIMSQFPGVYIKYNPLYISELALKGLVGPAINGLFTSKTIWRYE